MPVGMPAPDTPVAMERKVVDGTYKPWSFIIAFNIASITGSVADIGIGGTHFAFVMNQAKFDALPEDIKAIIDDMALKYTEIGGKKFTDECAVAMAQLKDSGGQIVPFPPAERAKIDKALETIWENWISEGEAKGLPRKSAANELYNTFKGMGIEKPFWGYQP